MDLKAYVKNNKSQIQRYKKYLKEVNWTEIVFYNDKGDIQEIKTYEARDKEYKLQKSMTESVLKRLTVLTKKYQDCKSESIYKTLLKNSLEVINLHLDRCDTYDSEIDLISTKSDYIRQQEMELSNNIFSGNGIIRDKVSELNLSLEDEEGFIEFHADSKAPLILHEKLSSIYPQILHKVKNIDFDSEPPQTMFVHDPKPPIWDLNKHYFDQEPKTLQYYVNESKKIRDGIFIGGRFISGWMYYHINFFVTEYPTNVWNDRIQDYELKSVKGVPPLRDNEWWIIMDNYELAKRENKLLFIAATRRAAKTTLNTSHIGYCIASGKSNILLAGGSSDDLGHIETNFGILEQFIHPFLRVGNLVNDWSKFVLLGIKTKAGKNITSSTIKVINLEGGTGKKSEKLAGFTPDAVIIDEIMKLPFKDQLDGLMPAIGGGGKKNRCVVILSGTAGNAELAKDAFEYLRSPDTYKVLNMPWEVFNSRVPEEERTWKERDFGTFLPGQMSSMTGIEKKKSNLADYLGVDNEELAKISMNVTDWPHANEVIRRERKLKEKDLKSYTKLVLYHPICPSDMLLSGKINPFPVTEAIMHREYILQKGGYIGRKVFLTQDPTGQIRASDNNNELPIYPFKGGHIDSPVVLYEDLPTETPPDNLYIGGFDDYKQDEAETDSVGSFHIYKVDVGFDKNCGKIVASYATRPDPHGKLHHQIYMLQQAFNAKCFMENADMDYKAYLENLRVADKWLMTSLDFDGDITREGASLRKYGWTPTAKNKKFLFSQLINYCKRVFTEYDEEGNPFQVLGVQRIDDVGLLDEIIAYVEGNNVDRCTSFMSCLGYEFYLNANYLLPNANVQIEKRREQNKKIIKNGGSPFFGKGKSTKFF